MEAGKTTAIGGVVHSKIDLIDAMIASSNDRDDQSTRSAFGLPTCGSCSGMFAMMTRPRSWGSRCRQRFDVGHPCGPQGLFEEAGRLIVDLCRRHTGATTNPCCPSDREPGGIQMRSPLTSQWAAPQHRPA